MDGVREVAEWKFDKVLLQSLRLCHRGWLVVELRGGLLRCPGQDLPWKEELLPGGFLCQRGEGTLEQEPSASWITRLRGSGLLGVRR